MNNDIITLYNKKIDLKYYKYYKFLFERSIISDFVDDIIPDFLISDFNDSKNKIFCDIRREEKNNYISEYWEKFGSLFKKLDRIKIDANLFNFLNEKEENSRFLEKFFVVDKNNFCERVVYNRVGTVTGRLIVKDGPNINNFPRRLRTILKSRFSNGKILSVDFKSLEPRILMKLSGIEDEEDVYQQILDISKILVDRSVIKKIILTKMYGGNNFNIETVSEKTISELVNFIDSFINFEDVKKESLRINEFGYRNNIFGRPLFNIDEKEHVVFNNFIQSTGVDISLDYFTDLCDQVDILEAVPLFVLHDAIVFDVNNDYYNKFVKIIKDGYNNKKLNYFPLEISEFNINEKC